MVKLYNKSQEPFSTKENDGWNQKSRNMKRNFMAVALFVLTVVLVVCTFPSRTVSTKKSDMKRMRSQNIDKSAKEIITSSEGFEGYATFKDTKEFSIDAVTHENANELNYRQSPTGHTLSSIGMGTYLGDPNHQTDELVCNAIIHSVNKGINVIDTASNYRGGRGELSVGMALGKLLSSDNEHSPRPRRTFQRSELFISTKAGFVSKESAAAARQKGAHDNDFLGKHCIAPACIEASIDQSLKRMNIHTIDLLYLHNVAEKWAEYSTNNDLYDMIHRAFIYLEEERKRGRIRYYGLATFSKSFRVPSTEPGGLLLDVIVKLAQQAAGCPQLLDEEANCDHGMRFIQLPVSPHAMPELYSNLFESHMGTLADAAADLGVGVFSSKSLGPPKADSNCVQIPLRKSFPQLPEEEKTRVLHVTRSSPGLLSALVGHKKPKHVRANLRLMQIAPLQREEFDDIVKTCL